MAKVIVEVVRGRAKVVEKTAGVTVLIRDLDISKDGKNIDRQDAETVIENGQVVVTQTA